MARGTHPKSLANLRKGRQVGELNHATAEIKQAAHALVTDPKYLASLRERLMRGIAPHMETLLHHYAFGKPKETLALVGDKMAPLVIDAVTDADIAEARAQRRADD